jgi:hypothetical protein
MSCDVANFGLASFRVSVDRAIAREPILPPALAGGSGQLSPTGPNDRPKRPWTDDDPGSWSARVFANCNWTAAIRKEKAHLDKVMVPNNNAAIPPSIEEPMPHDVIATCPVCAGELAVTRLRCSSCGTTLEGEFSVGRFGRLSREQMTLLESFLRSRGNLRDIERELGISYPTVRARVEALVRALGFGPRDEEADATDDETPTSQPASREEILERLARREISAEDAALAIRALGRKR